MKDNPFRDAKTKESFITYLMQHPQERFWQALRNWSGHPFILVGNGETAPGEDFGYGAVEDTFYWENRK